MSGKMTTANSTEQGKVDIDFAECAVPKWRLVWQKVRNCMTRDRILPKKTSREKQAVTLKSAIWAKMKENVQ